MTSCQLSLKADNTCIVVQILWLLETDRKFKIVLGEVSYKNLIREPVTIFLHFLPRYIEHYTRGGDLIR